MADEFNEGILDSIRNAGRNIRAATRNAQQSFATMIDRLRGRNSQERNLFTRSLGNANAPDIPSNVEMYRRLNQDELKEAIGAEEVGRMILFSYNPKHRDTLPYYDVTPLILLTDLYSDGFLGLNLHYLPPRLRATLLDNIVDNNLKNKYFNTEKKIRFNYNLMTKAARSNLFKPCVKRYLAKHVMGDFLVVPPEQWPQVLFLPFEAFEKADKRDVWRDSVRKMRS